MKVFKAWWQHKPQTLGYFSVCPDMEEIICLEHKNEAICKKKDSQKIDNKIEGYWKCAEGLNSIYSLSTLLKQNKL